MRFPSLIHVVTTGIHGSVLHSLLWDEVCIKSEQIYSEIYVMLGFFSFIDVK